ncbi:MAG TPA: restriction endonuclease subunit S, partial [Lacipirellulaceae bacterium]|nr:restriction endonuclease subunit S [Lacipirellulaceae bacterium]
RAPIGYVAIAANPISTNQGFKSIVPYIVGCSHFIALAMKSFAKAINDSAPGTTFKEVSGKMLAAVPFPLPPLAEQQRIVAKVEELMSLCDVLETESAEGIAVHQALVEALLPTLAESTRADDLAVNWAWLKAHFDILFTTDASVDALKQTILELAVRGKLVPQHAGDEPAAIMLEAVRKSGSDRGAKQKSHSNIIDADKPFDLPTGWCWERFDNLIDPAFPIAYGVLVPGPDQPDGVPFVRIADLSVTDPSPLPEKAIDPAVDSQYPRTRLKGGEILMGVVGSIGKLGVAPASWAGANIARAICRIVPSTLLDKSYVLWLLQSKFMQDSFSGDTRTLAQPTLNIGLIRLAATPVPPVAEQRRIAAKLDELIALCEILRTRLVDASAIQIELADTIVERAAV